MRPIVLLALTGCLTQGPAEHEPAPGKRLFVTRGAYPGAIEIDELRGVPAADKICNMRAKAAEVGGNWIAWLSTSSTDAIDRVSSLGPWHFVNGPMVFENHAQLYAEPLYALDHDERGDRVYPAQIWTGTYAGGKRATETCDDWTATTHTGRFGADATTFAWTDFGFSYCSNPYHLLCIEL